jgi:hypothetical protein
VSDHFRSPRAALRALALTAVLVGFVGCAPPLLLDDVVLAPTRTDTIGARADSTEVQLRYFSFSPTVSVVAWPAADAGYGLRAMVRRDGSLVRDHSLYVGTYYEPWVRSLYLAVAPPRQFRRQGVSRDSFACYFGKCSPFETLGIRITDEFLRANRDSVAVTLYGHDGRAVTITVRRDLIEAYLAAVDSVSAALRKRS